MIVTEKGRYRLLEEIKTRTSVSIGKLPKGTIIEIKQIDKDGHKVIGSPLMDWTHWDLPVERVETYAKGGDPE